MRTAQFLMATLPILAFVQKIGGQEGDSEASEDDIKMNVPINGQVIGGIQANPGQFPWQVRLLYHQRFVCGGSLIHPSWVLTAAHCIREGDYSVVLGTSTRDDFEEGRVTMDLPFQNIFVHPYYSNQINDIALMKLPAPLVLPATGGLINKIRLPNPRERRATFVGYTALSSGWGRDSASDNTSSSHELMFVVETILPNSDCEAFFKRTIPFTVICADVVVEDTATCSGDSGGPLIVKGSANQYILVGVNSFGHKDCIPGPEAFTRVGPFVSWIKEITGITF